jgi:hypothetical protein
MLRFGEIIRSIERYQSPNPLHFLAENVFLKGDDIFAAREAFALDWDPVVFDAKYISPTRRLRHFFVNLPLLNFDFDGDVSMSTPTCCFEEGFQLPAHVLDSNLTAKVC